jgi:cyclic pyranopterin phosphate synthase
LVRHEDILRYEEIIRLVRVVLEFGVRKIRITGGEPLVRRGVLSFLRELTALQGVEDVGLTTNGVLLSHMAYDLKQAGLTRINISLDSLRRRAFEKITGRDHLQDVLAGISAALKVGLHPVKINVVLLESLNEPDVAGFARMTIENPIDVRFIERMPFGHEKLFHRSSFSAHSVLEMIAREVGELETLERDALGGPATMFRLKGAQGRIGVINPVTGHFCGSCNRMRLTARGTLRPCLLSPREIDLKSALRNGATEEELAGVFRQAVLSKPVGSLHADTSLKDSMNMIGG